MSLRNRRPSARRNTGAARCRAETPAIWGQPTEEIDNFRLQATRKKLVWVADLIAPKCAVPMSIWYVHSAIYAITPDTTLALCIGNWEETKWENNYDTFIRQHMGMGLRSSLDRGKSLGATTYLGGALAAATVRGYDGVFSNRDRSPDAHKTWEGLQKAGLASEVPGEAESDVNCEEFYLSLGDLAFISGWDEEEVWDESPSLNKGVEICQRVETGSDTYDVIMADTVLESGLVLAVNLEELQPGQQRLFVQRRPTPELLVSLDLSFTPFETVRDWIHLLTVEDPWNTSIETASRLGVPRTVSGEVYLQAIQEALPRSSRPEFIPVWQDALASFSQMSLPDFPQVPWSDRPSPLHQAALREAALRAHAERQAAEAPRNHRQMYLRELRGNAGLPEASRFLSPDDGRTAQITAALSELD